MKPEALRAAAELATRLRVRKALQLQAQAAGLVEVPIPRVRLWSPEDAAAIGGWNRLGHGLEGQGLRVAGGLLTRLMVWYRLDRQVLERQEEELELHVCEIWESADECALVLWETFLARQTGQVPLFAGVAYA